MKMVEINMYTNFSTGKIMMGIAKCVHFEGYDIWIYPLKTYVWGKKRKYSSFLNYIF